MLLLQNNEMQDKTLNIAWRRQSSTYYNWELFKCPVGKSFCPVTQFHFVLLNE